MTRTTIVGVFEHEHDAQQAVRELRSAGFRDDQIGVVAHNTDRDATEAARVDDGHSHAGEGAIAGIATGAGMGALWGLGIAAGFLPAIGPAIAGGVFGTVLSSAAAAAAAGGLAGAMIGLGVPEDEAQYYEGEFRAGRTLVTVKSDTRCKEATSILRRFGAYDIDAHQTGRGATTTPTTEVDARDVEVLAPPVRREMHTGHPADPTSIDVPVERDEVRTERQRANEFPE